MSDIYACELCGREYLFTTEGLQLLQVRVEGVDEGHVFAGIVEWVVCGDTCADDIRNDKDTVTILTDVPWQG